MELPEETVYVYVTFWIVNNLPKEVKEFDSCENALMYIKKCVDSYNKMSLEMSLPEDCYSTVMMTTAEAITEVVKKCNHVVIAKHKKTNDIWCLRYTKLL